MKTKHAFIAAHASEHAIRFMCRVLGVAHSWFHTRRRAAPKRAERAARRGRLGSEIREIFEQSKRCYGAPRIHAELKARGFRISKPKAALFEYIEIFYNQRRRHSSIGYRTPAQARRDMTIAQGIGEEPPGPDFGVNVMQQPRYGQQVFDIIFPF